MKLTKKDYEKLKGVDARLVKVLERAAENTTVPFKVTEGLRTLERQKELVAAGYSKTLKSKHLTGHAVDIVPLLDVNNDGKLDQIDFYDWGAHRKLAPIIKKAAKELGVPLVWGGDWVKFPDGPHYQI